MVKSKYKQSSSKTFFQKGIRVTLIAFYVMLTTIILLVSYLLILSPGKIEPYRNQDGTILSESISEKIFVNIGGVEQGMFIKSKNIENPVLLFLHGGPGMPSYFLTKKFPNTLEDYFTVVYWEQRDAGMSYNPTITKETMTLEQLISDTVELTNYLRDRFEQDKIYLMGHSWGSFLGIQVASTAPDLYHAYIGVSQISNQMESEKIAYTWMMEQYQALNDTKSIKKLIEFPILDNDALIIKWFKEPFRDSTLHTFGAGTTHDMKNAFTGAFIPFLRTKEYTLKEKLNTFFRALPFLRNETELLDQLFTTNLNMVVPRLEVPVYFFSGIYDLTVNYNLTKNYIELLEAPMKGFYTFNESAHSPMFEEPTMFLEIMIVDVLNESNSMAD